MGGNEGEEGEGGGPCRSAWVGGDGEGGILAGAPAVRACTAGREPVYGEAQIMKTEEGTSPPACTASLYCRPVLPACTASLYCGVVM